MKIGGVTDEFPHMIPLMCDNFCDKNCHFEGSLDGMYTTMHWMLSNVTTEKCGNNAKEVSCRRGEYPEMVLGTSDEKVMLDVI